MIVILKLDSYPDRPDDGLVCDHCLPNDLIPAVVCWTEAGGRWRRRRLCRAHFRALRAVVIEPIAIDPEVGF